jgi:hypothetical protein
MPREPSAPEHAQRSHQRGRLERSETAATNVVFHPLAREQMGGIVEAFGDRGVPKRAFERWPFRRMVRSLRS